MIFLHVLNFETGLLDGVDRKVDRIPLFQSIPYTVNETNFKDVDQELSLIWASAST